MASPREHDTASAADMKVESPEHKPFNNGSTKRKSSFNDDRADGGSPKRSRHSETDDGRRRRSPSPYSQRRKSSVDCTSLPYDEPTRRPSATVEDKKRGKRLFGGLLNTLSQTNTNSQQKRRQEIEKRQHERMQKQQEEDKQQQQENRARLDKLRTEQQMDFEGRVMKQKHDKLLWTSRNLTTKSKPHIYYRPWKLSAEQKTVIDTQMRNARDTIEGDRVAFRRRERQHAEDHGYRRLSPPPQDEKETVSEDTKMKESEPESIKEPEVEVAQPDEQSSEKLLEADKPSNKQDKDDDTHEVEVMDEDTVIY